MYPTRRGGLHLAIATSGLILLLIAQQQRLVEIPMSGRFTTAMPNALHGAWFACMTWLGLTLFGHRLRSGVAIAVAAVLGFALAAATELLQTLTGGDAETSDVLFDMLGMGAGLSVWSAHTGRVAPRAGIAAAAVLLLGSLWPVADAFLIDRHRDSILPELVRFESPFVWDLVASSNVVDVVGAPDGWSIGGAVLRIILADSDRPGVVLVHPFPDWHAYSALEMEMFVAGDTPIPVTVSLRFGDGSFEHADHSFDCGPGPCRVVLPLARMFDRDVVRVNAVMIYSRRGYAGRVLYLGRVALVEGS